MKGEEVGVARDEEVGLTGNGEVEKFVVFGITAESNLFEHNRWSRVLDDLLQIAHTVLAQKITVELWPAKNLAQLITHRCGREYLPVLERNVEGSTRLRLPEQQRTDYDVRVSDDDHFMLFDQEPAQALSVLPQLHRKPQ